MSSQCVFVDFADRRKGKGDGAGAILHRLSADDDVGAAPNPIGGWREVQFGDATAHAGHAVITPGIWQVFARG